LPEPELEPVEPVALELEEAAVVAELLAVVAQVQELVAQLSPAAPGQAAALLELLTPDLRRALRLQC